MEIIDARWTPQVNVLTIRCDCGKNIYHRGDRWRVRCAYCGKIEDLQDIRQRSTKFNPPPNN